MRRYLASWLLYFTTHLLLAQEPSIVWQNTIGGSSFDYLYSVVQASDGGYLLGGYSKSDVSGDKSDPKVGLTDYWVVKLDAIGEIEWQKTIGGNNIDELKRVIQTADGGYLLGGYSESGATGDKTEAALGSIDYWVVKIDAVGEIEWQNTIGGSSIDELRALIQTTDGGYLIGGYSDSGVSGDKTETVSGISDFWVLKLDAVGEIEWQNTIGGNGIDRLNDLLQTSDGGYLLGGFSESGISGDKTEPSQGMSDYWVVKLDASGDITWQKTIGGSSTDELVSLIQTNDGGYLLGGYSNSGLSGDKSEPGLGSYDYWVVKLDTAGMITWQKTIGGSSDDRLYSLIQTTDGGYLTGGLSFSAISGNKTEPGFGSADYWIVGLDSAGTITWQKALGGTGTDYLYSLIRTLDDGYLAGGFSTSGVSGNKTEPGMGSFDYWVVKLEAADPVCIGPVGLTWTMRTSCSVDLLWGSDTDAADYEVRVRQPGSPPEIFLDWWSVGDTTEVTIEGLENNALYRFEVRSVCTDGVSPVISPHISLNAGTQVCDGPVDLQVNDITTSSAVVTWGVPCDPEFFQVAWRITGSSFTWTVLPPTADLGVILTGLPSGTGIDLVVRQSCAEGFSKRTATTFTTLPLREGDGSLESPAVYPNPTSGSIVITVSSPMSDNAMLTLFSMTGERVMDMQLNLNDGLATQQIELSEGLPNGVYLLNIQTDTRVFTEQVILQR